LPELADLVDALDGRTAILDGELIACRGCSKTFRFFMDVTPLYDIIHHRRDVRGQFTGEAVVDRVLDRVLSAAHAAPSVGLSQPWDFVTISERSVKEAFARHVREERGRLHGDAGRGTGRGVRADQDRRGAGVLFVRRRHV
jgi:hypothetical protein